ncbi:MAG: PepSY domain-containing protein [Vicinamibacterales bacterium]
MSARGIGAALRHSVIFVHRWLGVGLCLVFLVWFPSGFVMMYWDYPSVRPSDRLERAPALNGSQVRLSPVEAAGRAGLEPSGPVTLNMFDGRPVYRFGVGGAQTIVYADTGDERAPFSKEIVERIASEWTGQPVGVASVESIEDVDQWTLQSRIRDLKPLWKYSWPDGQHLYVSQATGEVVQYTTTGSRWGAYLGAIPHWFYYTPLRRHGPLWSQVVIWFSGIGTVGAFLGLVVGVWMYSPSRRYRHAGAPTSIPYHGWKRWHIIIGLGIGVGAVTWAFSGMLSMDPFPMPQAGGPAGEGGRRVSHSVQQALRGIGPLDAFVAKPPRAALAQLANLRVKELELMAFAGQPAYLATIAPGDTRVVPLDGEPLPGFDPRRIMEVAMRVAQPQGGAAVRVLSQYDRYYRDRHRQLPLPVVLVELNDVEHTRLYIDSKTARTVGSYSARNWMSRWLYHGFHSLDFPWLYNYRPAWDIVVIAFMTGGTALSVTSLVLAWQVLGRKLRATHGPVITTAESS